METSGPGTVRMKHSDFYRLLLPPVWTSGPGCGVILGVFREENQSLSRAREAGEVAGFVFFFASLRKRSQLRSNSEEARWE